MDKYTRVNRFDPSHRLHSYVVQICVAVDALVLSLKLIFGQAIAGYDEKVATPD